MDKISNLKRMLLQQDTLQACYKLARQIAETEGNPPRWVLMLAGWSQIPGTEKAILEEVLAEIRYEENENGN